MVFFNGLAWSDPYKLLQSDSCAGNSLRYIVHPADTYANIGTREVRSG